MKRLLRSFFLGLLLAMAVTITSTCLMAYWWFDSSGHGFPAGDWHITVFEFLNWPRKLQDWAFGGYNSIPGLLAFFVAAWTVVLGAIIYGSSCLNHFLRQKDPSAGKRIVDAIGRHPYRFGVLGAFILSVASFIAGNACVSVDGGAGSARLLWPAAVLMWPAGIWGLFSHGRELGAAGDFVINALGWMSVAGPIFGRLLSKWKEFPGRIGVAPIVINPTGPGP